MEIEQTTYGIGQEVNHYDREKIQSLTFGKLLFALGDGEDCRIVNIFDNTWSMQFREQLSYSDSEGDFIESIYVSANALFVLDLTTGLKIDVKTTLSPQQLKDLFSQCSAASALALLGVDSDFIKSHTERTANILQSFSERE